MTAENSLNFKKISKQLEDWFQPEERQLPWRESKDPYFVWISEIMLQQTTTQAVRGYFSKFIERWPTLSQLALADIEEVYTYWQGLGYYSRARNILKTAKTVETEYGGQLPKTAAELIKLPGIGPYTSRAISSICFDEPVGVVDGNVLRVYNRLIGTKAHWWEKPFFNETQAFSDKISNLIQPSVANPALMDLGSTICTPKSPTCSLCPLKKSCVSNRKNLQNALPLPKPRKPQEIWSYRVYKTKSKTTLKVSSELPLAPVLKGRPLPYGVFAKLKEKPKAYDFVHTITKHKIYVDFVSPPKKFPTRPKPQKLSPKELTGQTPSSLIKKIWQAPAFHESI